MIAYRTVVVVEEILVLDGKVDARVTTVAKHPLPGTYERAIDAHTAATTAVEIITLHGPLVERRLPREVSKQGS